MPQQPKFQFVNAAGEVVRVYATEEPFKFRITVDDEPFDMTARIEARLEREAQE